MVDYGANLRRLMARLNLTIGEVCQRSGLDERTVKGLLNQSIRQPQSRTLHRLAAGLAVDVDELFQNPSVLAHRLFDRATNPVVEEVTSEQPHLFEGWREEDFDELYSHFGAGGALTREGAVEVVQEMNRCRGVHQKVALILQSNEGDLLTELVETLYRRVVYEPEPTNGRKHTPAPAGQLE